MVVPITLIVVILVGAGVIIVAMFFQEVVRDIGWKILVSAVPFALPIAAVLAVSIGSDVYFFSEGGNSTVELVPIQSATLHSVALTPDTPPVQRTAPVQRADTKPLNN